MLEDLPRVPEGQEKVNPPKKPRKKSTNIISHQEFMTNLRKKH